MNLSFPGQLLFKYYPDGDTLLWIGLVTSSASSFVIVVLIAHHEVGIFSLCTKNTNSTKNTSNPARLQNIAAETAAEPFSRCVRFKNFILEYFWVSMSKNWAKDYKVAYYAVFIFVLMSSALFPLTESYISILWSSFLPVSFSNQSSSSSHSAPPFGLVETFVAVSDLGGKFLVANYFVLWFPSYHFMAILGCLFLCGAATLGLGFVSNLYSSYCLYVAFSFFRRMCRKSLSQYINAGMKDGSRSSASVLQGKLQAWGMGFALLFQFLVMPTLIEFYEKDNVSTISHKYIGVGAIYIIIVIILTMISLLFIRPLDKFAMKKVTPMVKGKADVKKGDASKNDSSTKDESNTPFE